MRVCVRMCLSVLVLVNVCVCVCVCVSVFGCGGGTVQSCSSISVHLQIVCVYVIAPVNCCVCLHARLSDGLSGLRADLGAFSRITFDDIRWERRRGQVLHEMLRYDPDIITLQVS